ncbi:MULTISPECIES: hypothetical protein [Pseudoalteromonas]|uniref:Uncharacterized protein n=1 Tax=Pseudoalteromonas luteoviolacea (strain 2ta16) TaxID=1353533 RepID=V4H3Y3_PSEL2|nr:MULTISPECIES: hypothetical protein [Pseudoalteromonas]ESP92191.1 hypothetical protein PL2TA16_05028 [Pseudoalteromonas luteoviolacea 2ta16]KZN29298.1 hypothetical protein N483_07640 [Pseudoalteromonas luteoviolacea NCIMB 1944]MCG7549369.1 hypothetical protein [Pseudoalteromonas sp. Of7M-16]
MFKRSMTAAAILGFSLFSSNALAGYKFERNIKEIQIYSDRIRINIDRPTYGSCKENDTWWGWSTSDPASDKWLSLVLSAEAQKKPIIVYDVQGSCAGFSDAIGLEAIFMKSV